MKLLFALLVVIPLISYSQSGYSLGYSDGFRYGCNCNDLPTKNVAYSQGTYDQGYVDGKLDGVVYLNRKSNATTNQQNYNPNQPHDYNNVPLYKRDTELIERVQADKQQKADERRYSIALKFKSIMDLIDKVNSKNNGLTVAQQKYVSSFASNMQLAASYDYSIYQNYLSAMDWLNKIEIEVLKWL